MGVYKMPYIELKDREELLKRKPNTVGELNYIITMFCKEYLEHCGESYTVYNNLVGVLESCKLELYRRKVALYEDKKIMENGDVY
jgi:hypothetical protein